jgi:hypothetical protein
MTGNRLTTWGILRAAFIVFGVGMFAGYTAAIALLALGVIKCQ